jgi:hypothetical protein
MQTMIVRIAALLSLAAVISFAPVNAGARSRDAFRITVPFAFVAGGETLPAGEYTVMRTSLAQSAFFIVGADNDKTAAVISASRIEPSRGRSKARLVFDSLGGEHYLAEIWLPSNGAGSSVAFDKPEQRLARQAPAKSISIEATR